MVEGLVSVIMSVYNSEDYLEGCINSILNQSYSNFQLIIIDDASSDRSKQIIKNFEKKDGRIVAFYNTHNKGLTYNLNRAIEASEGEFIARMDSDDISVRDRFEKQVDYLNKHDDVDICGSWAYIIDSNSKLRYCAKRKVNDDMIKAQLIFGNPMTHPSVMIRRSALDSTHYDESFRTMQDYKLWVDLYSHRFHNIPEFLLLYRINDKGVSKTGRKKVEERIKTAERIYQSLFQKLGINLSRNDMILFTRSMHALDKFNSYREAKRAISIIKHVDKMLINSDVRYAYSRWSISCQKKIGIIMPIKYCKGIIYRIIEVKKMMPARKDYGRVKECLQNLYLS